MPTQQNTENIIISHEMFNLSQNVITILRCIYVVKSCVVKSNSLEFD
jgi:hypothetical protein